MVIHTILSIFACENIITLKMPSTMKRLIIHLFFAVVMLPFTASAYDFMVDGIAYNINADNISVTVTSENPQPSENVFVKAYSGEKGELTIPETVTYGGTTYAVTAIGRAAFVNCVGFTGTLTIANSVKEIGAYAFWYCTGFEALNLGNSVTTIDSYAFFECGGFKGSLVLPNSLTTIGESAFRDCRGFTGTVTIPSSVTSINGAVFNNCTGLDRLTVASDNPTYDSRDNCNAVIETATNTLVCGIKTFSIPNSVTAIGAKAFDSCSEFPIGALTIPSSVTSIGFCAFYNCRGITGSLIIPEGVNRIEDHAFYNCVGLTGVFAIPNTLTHIGEKVFTSCRFKTLALTGEGDFNLTTGDLPGAYSVFVQSGVTSLNGLKIKPSSKVYSYAATAPACEDAFSQYSATLHVPQNSLASYFNAPSWSKFSNIVGDAVEPESYVWDLEPIVLKPGEQIQIDGPRVSPVSPDIEQRISVANSEVLSVSPGYNKAKGCYVLTVRGLKSGETDIIATCAWFEARCHVTVVKTAPAISLDKHELKLMPNEIATITPSSVPATVTSFAASSSDNSVAMVRTTEDKKVQVLALKPGVTTITVSDANGTAVPDTCVVTVLQPGDVDGSGLVDVDDLNIVINIMLHRITQDNYPVADVDSNGTVDIDDLNHLINVMLNKE